MNKFSTILIFLILFVTSINATNQKKNEPLITLTEEEKIYLFKKNTISICVNPKVLPYESIDEKGEYQGIGSDIMTIISKNIDKPIQLVPTKNWTESVENFKAKKCDVLPLVIYNPERKTYMNYTKPYIKDSVVIATNENAFFVNDSSDLSNKKIGVVNGYLFIKMLKQNNPTIEIIKVKNTKDGLKKVQNGELFGYVDALSVIAYEIQQNAMIDLKIAGKLEFTIDISIASRKDEPILNNIIQKALNHIEPEQIKSIIGKWIHIKIEESIDYKIVIYIILFFLSIITIIIYKNRSIHKISENLALLNKQILEKNELLEKVSSTDSLTKLPNRLLLEDRMSLAINSAKRNKTILACCLIDLDGFKEVNDRYGHDAGDFILVEASKRMIDSIRNVDTVARLGGDEFVILLTNLHNNQDSVKSLERVLHSLSQTYTYNNQNIDSISASIGVSFYPNDNKNAETLLRDADIAMYKSKNNGKNKYSLFESTSEYKITQNEQVLKKIKKAFEKNEFTLYYQPKLELQTAKIKEVEALARWKHPIIGIIPPAEFIPLILKDNELNLLFDKWVIKQALKQIESWQKDGIDLKVCVNISPKYFSRIDNKSELCKLIEEANIPKKLLSFIEYEILENDILNYQKESNTTIEECKAYGSTFALDDFGTGYSSIIHIKNLNVDTIKIDKSFVKEINSNTTNKIIVESINNLAKAFGMRVTAEGVETPEEIKELINIGCDSIQGYVISHPLTIEDLEEFLKDFTNHEIYKYIKENNGEN